MLRHCLFNILKERGGGKGQNQVNQQVKIEMGDDTDVNIAEIYKVLRAQGRKVYKSGRRG